MWGGCLDEESPKVTKLQEAWTRGAQLPLPHPHPAFGGDQWRKLIGRFVQKPSIQKGGCLSDGHSGVLTLWDT